MLSIDERLEGPGLRLEEDTSSNIGHDMEKRESFDPTIIDHIIDRRCSFQPIHSVSRKNLQYNGYIRQTELNEGACAKLKNPARRPERPRSTLSGEAARQ
uniref:Uncharacterized protein n=1 Tax=Timema bartmani TaxID=61472 RepID=A0A7R9F591_9NEOP|nr:unnamed protein product [Timema bartmani]